MSRANGFVANGYFNAYGNAARKNKHDYVLHLGDYIYETGRAGERATKPSGTIWTLGDYRTRHGLVSLGADVVGKFDYLHAVVPKRPRPAAPC